MDAPRQNNPNQLRQMYKNIGRGWSKTWSLPLSAIPELKQRLILDVVRYLESIECKNVRSNLTKKERDSIETLRKNENYVIKPADKGSGTVIWCKQRYVAEAEQQLEQPSYKN